MNCPCGCKVEMHGDYGGHWNGEYTACRCSLRKYDALRLAQRAAAINHLRGLVSDYKNFWLDNIYMSSRWEVICAVADAYRAAGILPERKP